MPGVFEKLRRNRRNIHQLHLIKMNTRSILSMMSKLGSADLINDMVGMSWYHVPQGKYELRIEAEGYKTQIMRVPIPPATANVIDFGIVLSKGDGTLVYGKGPTLAEMGDQIAKLTATIEELKKQIEEIKK